MCTIVDAKGRSISEGYILQFKRTLYQYKESRIPSYSNVMTHIVDLTPDGILPIYSARHRKGMKTFNVEVLQRWTAGMRLAFGFFLKGTLEENPKKTISARTILWTESASLSNCQIFLKAFTILCLLGNWRRGHVHYSSEVHHGSDVTPSHCHERVTGCLLSFLLDDVRFRYCICTKANSIRSCHTSEI